MRHYLLRVYRPESSYDEFLFFNTIKEAKDYYYHMDLENVINIELADLGFELSRRDHVESKMSSLSDQDYQDYLDRRKLEDVVLWEGRW